MKKINIILLLILATLFLTGCGSNDKADNNNDTNYNQNNTNNVTSKKNNNSTIVNIPIQGNTLDELSTNSENDVDSFIKSLEDEWEKISGEITTFEQYKENKEIIEKFYDKISSSTENYAIRIREYALKYAQVILNSDKSFDDKYDDLEQLYNDIYDGISEDIYDDIYDGLLEDMYNYYYNGIIDDAYDNVPYREYSEISSDEYGNYSDTRSDVYKYYSRARSDVYKFYTKLRNKLYSKNLDKALKELEDFSKDIDKLKK